MTAQVEILVTELDDVLSVPVQAVLRYDGKDHVAVKKPDGGFEWRDVDLGISNDKLVEVKHGIQSGEIVAFNPLSLMSDEEKRAKKIGGADPARHPAGNAQIMHRELAAPERSRRPSAASSAIRSSRRRPIPRPRLGLCLSHRRGKSRSANWRNSSD